MTWEELARDWPAFAADIPEYQAMGFTPEEYLQSMTPLSNRPQIPRPQGGPGLINKALDTANTAARYNPLSPRFNRAVEQKVFGRTFTPDPDEIPAGQDTGVFSRIDNQLANFQQRAMEAAPQALTLGLVRPQRTVPYAAGSGEVHPSVPIFGGANIESGAVDNLALAPISMAASPAVEGALLPTLGRVGANLVGSGIIAAGEQAPFLQGPDVRSRLKELAAAFGVGAGSAGAIEAVGAVGRGLGRQAVKSLSAPDIKTPSMAEFSGQSHPFEVSGLGEMVGPRPDPIRVAAAQRSAFQPQRSAERARVQGVQDRAAMREAARRFARPDPPPAPQDPFYSINRERPTESFDVTNAAAYAAQGIEDPLLLRRDPMAMVGMGREPYFVRQRLNRNLRNARRRQGLPDYDAARGVNTSIADATNPIPHPGPETTYDDFYMDMSDRGIHPQYVQRLWDLHEAGNAEAFDRMARGLENQEAIPFPRFQGYENARPGPPGMVFDPIAGTRDRRVAALDTILAETSDNYLQDRLNNPNLDAVGRRAIINEMRRRGLHAAIPETWVETTRAPTNMTADGGVAPEERPTRTNIGPPPEPEDPFGALPADAGLVKRGVDPLPAVRRQLTPAEQDVKARQSIRQFERSRADAIAEQNRRPLEPGEFRQPGGHGPIPKDQALARIPGEDLNTYRGYTFGSDEHLRETRWWRRQQLLGREGTIPGKTDDPGVLTGGLNQPEGDPNRGLYPYTGRAPRGMGPPDGLFDQWPPPPPPAGAPPPPGLGPRAPYKPKTKSNSKGLVGRGFGPPVIKPEGVVGSLGPQEPHPGSKKTLGGGLVADIRQGKATNVVSRAMEVAHTSARRVAQRMEKFTRSGIPGEVRRKVERNYKIPHKIQVAVSEYSGELNNLQRTLNDERGLLGGPDADPKATKRMLALREAKAADPTRVMPEGERAELKKRFAEIDETSKRISEKANEIADGMEKAGNYSGARHFREFAGKVDQGMNRWTHRSYSEKAPSAELFEKTRRALENRLVRDESGKLKLLTYDESIGFQDPKYREVRVDELGPADIEKVDKLTAKWMDDTLAAKEDISTPMMGHSTGPDQSVTRSRTLHDPIARMLRGQNKSKMVLAQSLAEGRRLLAQMEFFSKLAKHMKAASRLSPDAPKKLPNWHWIGEAAGTTQPRWFTELIEDNFGPQVQSGEATKAMGKLMKWYKFKNTVLNPKSHRNQYGQNIVNRFIAGRNPLLNRNFKSLKMAHQDLRARGPIFTALEKAGQLESFIGGDLKKDVQRAMDEAINTSKNEVEMRQKFNDLIDAKHLEATDVYSYPDRLSKMATYIEARGWDGGKGIKVGSFSKRQVLSHEQAVQFIRDHFVNFGDTTPAIEGVRNNPWLQLGFSPFFSAKMLSIPVWARAMSRFPVETAAFMSMMAGGIGATAYWKLKGVPEEDQESARIFRSSTDKNKVANLAGPSLGDELETYDLGAAVPNSEFASAFGLDPNESLPGNLAEVMLNTIGEQFVSGPVASAVYGPFKKEMHPEQDYEDQLAQILFDEMAVPGGSALRKRTTEFSNATNNLMNPGSHPGDPLNSDDPVERLSRAYLDIFGLAGKPLDARGFRAWDSEQKRKQNELSARTKPIEDAYMRGDIDDAEFERRMEKLMNAKVNAVEKSLEP